MPALESLSILGLRGWPWAPSLCQILSLCAASPAAWGGRDKDRTLTQLLLHLNPATAIEGHAAQRKQSGVPPGDTGEQATF